MVGKEKHVRVYIFQIYKYPLQMNVSKGGRLEEPHAA